MTTALIRETREKLAPRFPLCFASPPLPLKVGILSDLYRRCPDIPADLLRRALIDYCESPAYQTALTDGAIRFDLDGNACGAVTEKQAAHALAARGALVAAE